MPDWIPDWASIIGLAFSVIGVALTVYVLIEVRRLQKGYSTVYRVPEYAKLLEAQASELARCLDDEEPRALLSAMARMRTTLESIADNVGKGHAGPFLALRDRIRELERGTGTPVGKLNEVYAEAQRLAQRAQSLAEDRKHKLG